MKRIIGLEIGASRIVAAVAEEDGFARVILGADASWPSSVDVARDEVGPAVHLRGAAAPSAVIDRWKWSIDVLSSSADAARRALHGVRGALADRGAADAELTVIALSTGYGDGRADALVKAAASVGFPALRVMDECSATALGVGRTWLRGRGLVIDLGARHLSASVVALSGERITALASDGTEEVHLDLFTEGVLRELVDGVERAEGAGVLDRGTVDALRREVRVALGARRGAGPLHVRSPSLQEMFRTAEVPVCTVEESVLAWLREEVLLKAHEVVEAVLEHAGVRADEVARVWLTGAAARDDSLRAALAGHLRREVLVAPVDLIACGAARFGAELLGRVSHTPLPVVPNASVRPVMTPVPDLAGIAAMVEVDRGRHLSSMAPSPLAEGVELEERTVVTRAPEPPREEVVDRGPPTTERHSAPPPPTSVSRSTHPPGAAHLPAQGAFRGPKTPVEVLGMPLMRAPTEEELARPYLPVLLLQLATAHATGVLSLKSGREEAKLLVSSGGVCVSATDRARASRVLEWTEGTFRWASAPVLPAAAKLREGMLAFVAGGLRNALRGMSDAGVLAAFGPRLALSPMVIPERSRRAERMDLGAAELRAIDHMLDGTRDVPTLLGEGYIGRLTLMRVLLLLDAFGVLRWVPPSANATETPVDALKRRLARMDHEDHFTALGLHWTATHDEVIEAWTKFQAEYGPAGRWAKVDPGVAAKLLARGATAWERLRDDRRRVQYRHELHPDVDETMLSTIVAAQAELLAFRGEERQARSMRQLAVEMATSIPPPPPKDR